MRKQTTAVFWYLCYQLEVISAFKQLILLNILGEVAQEAILKNYTKLV